FSSAYLKIHPVVASHLSDTELRAHTAAEPLWGLPVEEIDVVESGVHYLIRPAARLSVGLFLDMREVRTWLLGDAARGRTVLNLFAYTCSLGVGAMLGGATRVLNLDVSRSALAWGQENYRLNDLDADP